LTFGQFYRTEFPSLVVLASAVAHDATFAEDIAQEAMGVVHDRWAELSASGPPRAWVRRLVVNRSIDRRRRLGRELALAPKLVVDEAPPVRRPAEHAHLWNAVRSLPVKQRAAVALFYLNGHSTSGVAEVLDCSEQSVRTTLHRARARLRSSLGSRTVYEGLDV
jgi:RNA polymerase sigma-70 factor (ECF subfamily)